MISFIGKIHLNSYQIPIGTEDIYKFIYRYLNYTYQYQNSDLNV